MTTLFVASASRLRRHGAAHAAGRLGLRTAAFGTAAACCSSVLCVTLASPQPARAQELDPAVAATQTEWNVTDHAPRPRPRFQVQFLDDTGSATGAIRSTDSAASLRSALFGIDEALATKSGGRARGLAESVDAFALELQSPRTGTLESAGRFRNGGPRYSFTPRGLVVAWPSSNPVNREGDRFKWDSYLKHNLRLLACLHGKRILFEEKTRRGMREPLLRQWRDDILAIPRSWGDEDPFATNYVGHPMMGAVMGYLQVLNHPVHARLEFGDRGYWKARGVTLAAAAVASTQFEIGPLSEATMGLHPSKQGMSDFVVTPLLGTGLIVAEDALDHYVIVKLETGRGAASRRILRCALNPSRTIANLVALRAPWRRDTRSD